MKVEHFIEVIGADFYVGVPDSQLRALCDCLVEKYGMDSQHHIIAANEGNCVAIAAGYHLATKKNPVVYLQNSGQGNIINPVVSLLHEKVYAIPVVFVIGWRGEPGVYDEPQHIYQGEITTKLLDDMGIDYYIIDKDTTVQDCTDVMKIFKKKLSQGKSVAFLIKKNGLSYETKVQYENENQLLREDVIRHITSVTEDDPIISTTGKASRELFEIREEKGEGHEKDFLTVGSMGHASGIALGVAINKPNRKVWCIDGDGALLMHMGTLPIIGSIAPRNLVHVVINNGAHETVGGMPTVAQNVHFGKLAEACGYKSFFSVSRYNELRCALEQAKQKNELCMIEVKCAIGARTDLGRPTTTTYENKEGFMTFLENNNS